MHKFIHRLKASEFWQAVATLVSGSFLAQLVAVLLTPVLTRLYLPEAFGISAMYIAGVAIFVVIANGGYEWAIMLPKEEATAFRLLTLSLWVSLALSIFLFVLSAGVGAYILDLLRFSQLKGWHLLFPFSLLLEGCCRALRIGLNRNKQYKALSLGRIAKSWTQVLSSLGLALLGFGYEGLILGFVLGQLANLCFLAWPYWRWLQQQSFSSDGVGLIREARKYQDFPKFIIMSNWLNQASKHLPYYFLPFFFSQEINGHFTQAERILFLPIVMISMSIGTVYFEQASKAFQDSMQSLASVTRKTFLRLLLLGLPFLLVILIGGPNLFAWVLGPEWYASGVYARWLMPWVFLAFLASPLAYLIDIRRKLKWFLYFNIGFFIARLASLWIGCNHFAAEEAIMLYGLVSMAFVLIQLIYLLKIGGFRFAKGQV